jgi:uncharacterized protein (DUF4415 family)
MGFDGEGKDGRNKVSVKLLIDRKALERLRSHGPDWEQYVNKILRAALLKNGDNDTD